MGDLDKRREVRATPRYDMELRDGLKAANGTLNGNGNEIGVEWIDFVGRAADELPGQ